IADVEERLGAVAVGDQLVKRREQRDAIRDRAILGVEVGVPPVALEPDAAGTEAELGQPPVGLAKRDSLGLRIPPLGEVPQPLPAAAADDRDLAPVVEGVQHLADTAAAVPAVVARRRPRSVLELAGEERAARLELGEDVTPEPTVRCEEGCIPPLPRRIAPAAPHPRLEQRER